MLVIIGGIIVKLRVMSDLHLEAEIARYSYLGEDVIVFAGDLAEGLRGVDWIKKCVIPKARNIPVIYTVGNHEYYRQPDISKLNKELAQSTLGTSIKCCPHGTFVHQVGDQIVAFIAHPYWVDFNLYGNEARDGMMWRRCLNDSRWSSRKGRMMSIDDVKIMHNAGKRFIRREIKKHHGNVDEIVLVTHHFPEQSIHPKYKGDILNPGFASRWPDDILYGPNYIIHGHTHDSMNYNLEHGPKVVCNPRGYVNWQRVPENQMFDENLILEI